MNDSERQLVEVFVKGFHDWAEEVRRLNLAFQSTTEAVKALNKVLMTPAVRRLIREHELGYKIPDWVWKVEETMRRTEGSGNGRIMRD